MPDQVNQKNRIIRLPERILMVTAVMEIAFLVLFFILIKNGTIAVNLIELGKYQKAGYVIAQNKLYNNSEIENKLRSRTDAFVDDYINEDIIAEEARRAVDSFINDYFAGTGYEFVGTEALGKIDDIYNSREQFKIASSFASAEENISTNYARAVNYYNNVSEADINYYNKSAEEKKKVISDFDKYIKQKFSEGSASEALKNVDAFIRTCRDNECDDHVRSQAKKYIADDVSKIKKKAESYRKKSQYAAAINCIDSYIEIYKDYDCADELKTLRNTYFSEWIGYLTDSGEYNFLKKVVNTVGRFGEADTDSDIINSALKNYKEYLNSLIRSGNYAEAEKSLEANKDCIDEYASVLGYSYKKKIVDVYGKWFREKLDRHEFLDSDDGKSAYYILMKSNEVEKGSISLETFTSEAASYFKIFFLNEINEKRKANGNPDIVCYKKIDSLARDMVKYTRHSEYPDYDVWSGVEKYDIESLYNGDIHYGYFGYSVAWFYTMDGVRSADEFIEINSEYLEKWVYSGVFTKLGSGIYFDEDDRCFYWIVVLFT